MWGLIWNSDDSLNILMQVTDWNFVIAYSNLPNCESKCNSAAGVFASKQFQDFRHYINEQNSKFIQIEAKQTFKNGVLVYVNEFKCRLNHIT